MYDFLTVSLAFSRFKICPIQIFKVIDFGINIPDSFQSKSLLTCPRPPSLRNPARAVLTAGIRFYFFRRFLLRFRQHGEWPLYFFVRCTWPREVMFSGLRSKAERNPMLPFAFERRLLTFSAKTPAFDWLFQFPPAIGRRIRPFPKVAFPFSSVFCYFFSVAFIQPPSILPISSR